MGWGMGQHACRLCGPLETGLLLAKARPRPLPALTLPSPPLGNGQLSDGCVDSLSSLASQQYPPSSLYLSPSPLSPPGVVDAVLIPEIPFTTKGPHGLFDYLSGVLKTKGHCVVCVAEGAGQVGARRWWASRRLYAGQVVQASPPPWVYPSLSAGRTVPGWRRAVPPWSDPLGPDAWRLLSLPLCPASTTRPFRSLPPMTR